MIEIRCWEIGRRALAALAFTYEFDRHRVPVELAGVSTGH